MNAIQFCEPNETCCVIEEPQSMDGVAIMTYAEIKRTNTQNPILFTGTYEECDQWRSQFTWDNPYTRTKLLWKDTTEKNIKSSDSSSCRCIYLNLQSKTPIS